MAVIGFVTQILIAFNFSHVTVEKITGVIMSGVIVIAYILGEGLADSTGDIHIHTDDFMKEIDNG